MAMSHQLGAASFSAQTDASMVSRPTLKREKEPSRAGARPSMGIGWDLLRPTRGTFPGSSPNSCFFELTG